jgi:hypothetical protein
MLSRTFFQEMRRTIKDLQDMGAPAAADVAWEDFLVRVAFVDIA